MTRRPSPHHRVLQRQWPLLSPHYLARPRLIPTFLINSSGQRCLFATIYLSITVLVVSMLSVGPTTFDIKDLANVFYTDYEIGSLDSNPHSTNSVAYAYYKFWIFYLPIDWLEFKLFMFLFLGKFPKSPKLQKKNLNKFWQFLDSSMRTKSVYYGLVECLLRVSEFHWGK